ncbi:MAG: branched-chain amino acid ABC transporter substrate-binding protein [Propioniciclava sp.]|uniref:branched-chain amino acid ABC transporter substrate-binding protein n=1 Tax=Propioniciclava sp. TaxID=2038686 RepID=UPI0039E310EF
MKRRIALAGVSGLLLASVALTGCGQRNTPAAPSGGGAAKKVATIGVIAPLSGGLSAMGNGIKNSVDLAVRQANETNAIPGWELKFVAEDDQGQPDPGRNAATKLVADKTLVGVVGPLNSSVGQAMQPVFESAGIPLISSANTNPSLTRGADLANPKRAYSTYFRTCATDDVQGPFAAKYLLDEGIKEIATIHDKKTYGAGLVGAFSEAFTKGGGTIVAAETINPDDKDFSAVISKVKAANPKLVYYGGEHPQAAPLSQQMKAAGLTIPLMGGDGIFDKAFIDLAGASASGDLATNVGAPAEALPTAAAFVAAYEKAGFSGGYGAYGIGSYDAGTALIEALKVSLKDAGDAESARKATVEALNKVSFTGASGKVSFDQYGDNTTRTLTVYKVENGEWKAVRTEDYK